MRYLILASGLTLLAAGFVQAAEVKVEWVEPEKFTDVRPANDSRKVYRERVMKKFDGFFQDMAANLPQDYQWQVKVTDIDLAGDIDYFATGNGQAIRVIKDIYSPMIKFSYVLHDKHGEQVAAGEEKLRDMGFMQSVRSLHNTDEFRYEQQMLQNWFKRELEPKVEQYAQSLPKVSGPTP